MNQSIDANTNGKMKKFMHDLLMLTFTEELRVNMKILVVNANTNGKMKKFIHDLLM